MSMVGAYELSPQLDERGFAEKYSVDDLRDYATSGRLFEDLSDGGAEGDAEDNDGQSADAFERNQE
jgi:hypothetical protein